MPRHTYTVASTPNCFFTRHSIESVNMPNLTVTTISKPWEFQEHRKVWGFKLSGRWLKQGLMRLRVENPAENMKAGARPNLQVFNRPRLKPGPLPWYVCNPGWSPALDSIEEVYTFYVYHMHVLWGMGWEG